MKRLIRMVVIAALIPFPATAIRAEEASIGQMPDLPLFVADSLPSDLAAPRAPNALDHNSAVLLTRAFASCGPEAAFRSVIQPIAEAARQPVAAPKNSDAAMATWLSIASLTLDQSAADAIVGAYGLESAANAVSTLCKISHDHIIDVALGHEFAGLRLSLGVGPQKTSQLDATTISLWPLIRQSDPAIRAIYPSDFSNLTAANYPGAALAQALSAPAEIASRGLEVRRFYEPYEVDHDRVAFRTHLEDAAQKDPTFAAFLRDDRPVAVLQRRAVQAFIINLNWLTWPTLIRSALGVPDGARADGGR